MRKHNKNRFFHTISVKYLSDYWDGPDGKYPTWNQKGAAMKLNSDAANKIIKNTQAEIETLLAKEDIGRTYT